jgi:hypothetical protein
MGACWSLITPHTTHGEIFAHNICSIMKDHHLTKINQFEFGAWHPYLEKCHIQQIASMITKSTKENKIKIFDITGFKEDYIAYQIAYHISKCIFNCYVENFEIKNDLPIDQVFIDRTSFELPGGSNDNFINTMQKLPDNTCVDIKTTDVIVKEMLKLKFKMLATSVIEKIDVGVIYITCFKKYEDLINTHHKEINQAKKSFLEPPIVDDRLSTFVNQNNEEETRNVSSVAPDKFNNVEV